MSVAGTTARSRMRIVEGGMGSFLCPPGHPNHFHSIEDGPRSNPTRCASLDYALTGGDVPDRIRETAQAAFDESVLVCSELWLRNVYGYFRNSYSRDGADRSVINAVFDQTNKRPAAHHLAHLLVLSYFPGQAPRLDLIASRGDYGPKPCTKCGTTLQYEASVDAFAVAITFSTVCPNGGSHEV